MTQTTAAEAPKIEFPCEFPIKVMGEAAPDFKACVLDVLITTETGYVHESVSVMDSRNGRFQSVRVTIEAESEQHLTRLHQALKETGRVQMVL
ncbi:hypothetical protein SAMN05660443_1231 [Marinospirillum celere]|uniref:UPF0250 protein SAMN05660443_1231 n=1 Tax=Marinospirillum celere TaxID=1122252 RepID=A0A1I1G0B0_9GAMM|nr:DUF493 domain-containing protein [Marinospirillum celere]SFC03258.1 hypothetical protein SAMN05660443_1231 [Marinospirillum celere]